MQRSHLNGNNHSPLVECIPNISTANAELLEAITQICDDSSDLVLLDIDSSVGLGRSVLTWIGTLESTFQVLHEILDLLVCSFDLKTYQSAHPHVGALDICPIVPLFGRDHDRVLSHSADLASELAHDFHLPIFYYGKLSPEQEAYPLHQIRRGGPRALAKKIGNDLQPSVGPKAVHSVLGATLLGVRGVMTAYNINLSTDDLDQAKILAIEVRKQLPVKAMAWYSEDFDRIQLSMNIYNHSISLPGLYENVNEIGSRFGIACTGSEVIGLVCRPALELPCPPDSSSKTLVHQKIEQLGLSEVKIFDPQHHLLEDRIFSICKEWPDI